MQEHTDAADPDRGQVTGSAAEVYEEFFVPALFAQFTDAVLAAADVGPGDRVLDVACGTGVLARAAGRMIGTGGSVVGVDINPAMIAVAARTERVEWREGAAEQLPFDDASFDVVVSQFGLMFFADRATALREMGRVVQPDGRVAIAVWAALEQSPGYATMVDLLERLFGDVAADALRAPFALGDARLLDELVSRAGFRDVDVATVPGTARFSSLEAWMHTDIRGWTLADQITNVEFAVLTEHARNDLARFAAADGTIAFDAPALVITARPPPR